MPNPTAHAGKRVPPPVEVPPTDEVDSLRELAKKEADRLANLKKKMVAKQQAKFQAEAETRKQLDEGITEIVNPDDSIVALSSGELGKLVKNQRGDIIKVDPMEYNL